MRPRSSSRGGRNTSALVTVTVTVTPHLTYLLYFSFVMLPIWWNKRWIYFGRPQKRQNIILFIITNNTVNTLTQIWCRVWSHDTHVQMFKVKGLKVKVTVWHNLSPVKRYWSGTNRLSDFRLGESYPRAERNVTQSMFKVIRSNIETEVTTPRTAAFRSNLVQSLNTSRPIHYKCSKSKGQRSRSHRNVRYQH